MTARFGDHSMEVDSELEYTAAEGVIDFGSRRVGVNSARATRSRFRPDLPWKIEFTLAEPDRARPGKAPSRIEPGGVFRLRGWLGGDLEIRQVTATGHSGAHHYARAWELNHNAQDLPTRPQKQFVLVSLVNAPTPPLNTAGEPWPDRESGEIETWQVSTACGPAEYRRGRVSERVRGPSGDGEVRFWIPELRLELRPPRTRKKLTGFERALRQDLKDISAILSMMSRRHVDWDSIEIMSVDDDGHMKTAVFHRPGPIPVDSRKLTPLLNSKPFSGSAFQHLLDRYRKHELKSSIRAAIVYTTAFHNRDYAEAGLVYAFTALEALVNGWSAIRGDDTLVPSGTFSTLRSAVQSSVRSWAKTHGLTKRERALLYGKIGELQRPPLIPRVVEMVDELSVEWDDLWTSKVGLKSALEAAYGRRSIFIHQGMLPEFSATTRDALRISALTERIVFSLLEGQAEWIWPLAYREVRGLRYS